MISDGGSYLIDKKGKPVLVHQTQPPEPGSSNPVANTAAEPYDAGSTPVNSEGGNDA